MNVLSQETTRQLQGFGFGVLSPAALEMWVIAAEDDEVFPAAERVRLSELRLLLLELSEGKRELSEVQSFVWAMLSENSGPTYSSSSNVTPEVTILQRVTTAPQAAVQ